MTNSQKKWNDRYAEWINQTNEPSPNAKLVQLIPHIAVGTALDIACGLGGNSFFLAEKGFQVHAYDISDVAVNFIKKEAETRKYPIIAQQCDLTDYHQLPFIDTVFELVVITNYLDRALFPIVKDLVVHKGYFFMDTFSSAPEGDKNMPEKYKLQSQELVKEFNNWKVLYFEELNGRQTILCQKV